MTIFESMGSIKRYPLLLQVLFCCLAWLIIRYSLLPQHVAFVPTLIGDIPFFISLAILFPLNKHILLPLFCYKRKYGLYLIVSFVIILLTVFLLYNDLWPWLDGIDIREERPLPFGDRPMHKNSKPIISMRWVSRGTPIVIAFLANTLIELANYANKKEKLALVLEKEKIATDLLFLKSQINPHFLFNAMNNLYSLAVAQSAQTAENIMRFSEMLRYMVYDSSDPVVPLNSEIQYIKNFISLQLLKDSRGMNVSLDFVETDKTLMIAPLIFIPFVENAFKHSNIENISDGFIDIKLDVQGRNVDFLVVNSVPKLNYTKDKIGGVGLENIKRRLNLLYPNGLHSLEIQQDKRKYEVKLTLVL